MRDDQDKRDDTHDLVRDLLDDYVDGALPASQARRVEAHVRDCVACRAEVESLRALIGAARALPPAMSSENELWPDLKKRIRQRPVAVVASGRPSHATVHSIRESPRWVRGGVAAAAAIIVLAGVVWLAERDAVAPGRGRGDRPGVASTRPDDALPGLVRGLENECRGADKMLQASLTNDGEIGESIAESVRDGVAAVDRSIVETRTALETHPDDVRLVKQLTMRYRQKLNLLLGTMRIAEDV